jgi:integrase
MTETKCPPGLRIREGKWHYRVKHQGLEWTGSTGLAATRRNVSTAMSELAKARESIRNGQAERLSLEPKKFNEAAEEFLKWSEGEHRDHPNTAKRLRTSFASLKRFFGNIAVHSIAPNAVEKFKTWRRIDGKVQEITIRHDLHALAPFFDYAVNANWSRENPVRKVAVPSAEDAVRDHVVTAEEEKEYFVSALSNFEVANEKGKTEKHGPFPALHDVARIILDQGMRPDEVMSLRVENVDFEKVMLTVVRGKSRAARRTLVMTPTVKSILAKRTAGRFSGWVFDGKKPGEHLTKLNNAHDAVLKKIGSEFVLYEFRHTFATRFGEAVGDPIALATILGHANLKTVMRYCHPRESHTTKGMERYILSLSEQTKTAAPEAKAESAGIMN